MIKKKENSVKSNVNSATNVCTNSNPNPNSNLDIRSNSVNYGHNSPNCQYAQETLYNTEPAVAFRDYSSNYLETIGRMKLKENTICQNQYILDHYIYPILGNMNLSDITVQDINDCFFRLTEDAKLSASSVVRIKGVISPVFSYACRERIIEHNPVTYCTLPRVVPKHRKFADIRLCKKIISYSKTGINEQLARALIILIYTGIRSGELCALHWDDIDFNSRCMRISYTLFRRNGKATRTDPKTESSIRIVALSEEVIQALIEQKEYCGLQQRKYYRLRKSDDNNWHDTNAVFINRSGGYLNGQYLNNEFKRLQKRIGCSSILHIHDLRHANASILINAGVPLKIVSEHLGHSNTQITEKFYTHIFEDNRNMTADIMSKALL